MIEATFYSGESFELLVSFEDEEGEPATPDTLNYKILNRITGALIREDNPTPSEDTYNIPIKVSDNTIASSFEKRKVVVSWTYNSGEKGDVKVFNYTLKSP